MMDLRDAFWFAVGLLTALVVGFAPRSWLPQPGTPKAMRTLRWSAMGALIVAVTTLGLYAWRGKSIPITTDPFATIANINPSKATAQVHGSDSLDTMLTGLERRLRSGGGTAADWELLARTYDVLGRSADASNARGRHEVASATAAAGDDVWTPDLIAAVLDNANGASTASAPPDEPDTIPAVAQRPASAKTQDLQTSAAPVQVSGEVTLAESLQQKVPAGLTLFIVAKSINSPGAPVAVVRAQTGQWPLKFMLDDSLAMLPERKLSTAGRVTVEARVSRSGAAASQAGDLQSAPTTVDPRSGQSMHLVIDHIID